MKVFIGENGSNDYTFDVIQKKISTSNIYNFVDTSFIEIHEDRIKRLALARQALKEKFLNLNIKSKFVCVIEMTHDIASVRIVACVCRRVCSRAHVEPHNLILHYRHIVSSLLSLYGNARR